MNRAQEIAERMRKRYTALGVIGKDAQIGVVSSFGDGTTEKPSWKQAGSDRLVRQIITTDDIDMDDEVVDPAGADFSYINENKTIFLDHNYESEYSIGSIRWQSVMDGGRGIEASLCLDKDRRVADDCWKILQQRGKIGASIGFEATLVTPPSKSDPERWKSARSIVRKFRIMELSLTCLPCNVSCQTLAYREDAKRADVQELVTKGALRKEIAEAMGWLRPPEPRHRFEFDPT